MKLPGYIQRIVHGHGDSRDGRVIDSDKELIEFIQSRERKAFEAGWIYECDGDHDSPNDGFRDWLKSEDYND